MTLKSSDIVNVANCDFSKSNDIAAGQSHKLKVRSLKLTKPSHGSLYPFFFSLALLAKLKWLIIEST